MSRSFFLGSFFLFLQVMDLQAQAITRNPKPIPTIVSPGNRKNFASSITITDVNGRPFQNAISEVEGNPYFLEDFRYARLTLNLGSVYESIRVKIDICSQEAHVLNSENKEFIAEKGLIRYLTLTDSTEAGINSYQFQTGFPSIDKNSVFCFYQVLSDGKLQLLKLRKKEIVSSKDVMSGDVSKSYVQYENFYVFHNDEMLSLKKDKDFVMELMKDREPEINEWLKKNKTNFKNIPALIKLFDYYNSLFVI